MGVAAAAPGPPGRGQKAMVSLFATTAIEGQPVEGLVVKLRRAVLARETTGVDGAGERRLQGSQARLVEHEGIDLPIPSARGEAAEFNGIHPLRHSNRGHDATPRFAARG